MKKNFANYFQGKPNIPMREKFHYRISDFILRLNEFTKKMQSHSISITESKQLFKPVKIQYNFRKNATERN